MTDKIAARLLARLHAKGLLVGIWVPPSPCANCVPCWPNGPR